MTTLAIIAALLVFAGVHRLNELLWSWEKTDEKNQ